ncbi:MAG: pseudouridine synthase [Oligoflexia bacterium]|nr:pseudouridine synthase [Oligoflexia bacterium]
MMKYIAFYKPFNCVSQFTGEGVTLSEYNLPSEVYAAGRLDKDSEGLLLLTNDGPFIKKVTDPKNDKEKIYWVQVEKIPEKKDLEKLSRGVVIKGYKTKPCQVKILEPEPKVFDRDPPIRERKNIPTCWLEIKLTEGKNRQVRRMTAAIGFPTLRLIRVAIGKLNLGNLKPGEYREVKKSDIL